MRWAVVGLAVLLGLLALPTILFAEPPEKPKPLTAPFRF